METIQLNENVFIPQIGLGTWKLDDLEVAKKCVLAAIQSGYRHIDTAMGYGNEEAVGQAIKESGIPRDQIFVTTKLSNDFRGREETLQAFEDSLKRLQMDYVDLFLIHWPAPKKYRENYVELNNETYAAMEELYALGKIRALGVSNFMKHHLEELSVKIPVSVNQIEFHPYYADWQTIQYCQQHHIVIEGYSPLGKGQILSDPLILELAGLYHKTPTQICLRYAIDNHIIPLPKSQTLERIKENLDIFDFSLKETDIERLRSLSSENGKIGSHPDFADF